MCTSGGKRKPVKRISVRTFQSQTFLQCTRLEMVYHGIHDYCGPCQLLWWNLWPQHPYGDHIWQAIEGKQKGSDLSTRQTSPLAEGFTVYFCFPESEFLGLFKIAHINFQTPFTSEQSQKNGTGPRDSFVKRGEKTHVSKKSWEMAV